MFAVLLYVATLSATILLCRHLCVSSHSGQLMLNHSMSYSAQQDAVFELVSMGFNVAVWYTKYASRLAGKEK